MGKQRDTRTRYPSELKERAVRMARDLQLADPRDKNVISRVSRQLRVGGESLRLWIKQADIDADRRLGLTTDEQAELAKLRKENRELRRTIDIKIDASFKIALARFRSLFSRSSCLSRARSSVVSPGREPLSTWVLRTQVLSVSADMPKSFEIAVIVAHSDG